MAAFAYPIAADDGGQAAPGSLRGALFIAAGFAAAGVGETRADQFTKWRETGVGPTRNSEHLSAGSA